MPAPDNGSAKYHQEMIDRLFSTERDALIEVFGRMRDGSASEEDHEYFRSVYRLAQERFDAGLIILRERKPPQQYNEEMREALRVQRETGGPWRGFNSYNEFLVEADNSLREMNDQP